MHNAVASRDGGDGEFKLRGTARNEPDAGVQARYAAEVSRALGWEPEPGKFHLFAVDFDQVDYIRYDDATGDQYVAMWPPAREFVRRGTSATSVGDPEPRTEILSTS